MGKFIQLLLAQILPALSKYLSNAVDSGKLKGEMPKKFSETMKKFDLGGKFPEGGKGKKPEVEMSGDAERAASGLGDAIRNLGDAGGTLMQAAAFMPSGGKQRQESTFRSFMGLSMGPKPMAMARALTGPGIDGVPISRRLGAGAQVGSQMLGTASTFTKEQAKNLATAMFDPRPAKKLDAAFKGLANSVKMVRDFPFMVMEWGEALHQSQASIKDFNAQLSSSFIEKERRRIIRATESGKRVAPSVSNMTKAIDDLRDEVQPYLDTITILAAEAVTLLAKIAEKGINIAKLLSPAVGALDAISRLINDAMGQQNATKDSAFVAFMQGRDVQTQQNSAAANARRAALGALAIARYSTKAARTATRTAVRNMGKP